MQCAGFDHDHYQEAACAYHEEHMMHDCVQLDHVDEYTHDSNIIIRNQHVKDNEVLVVHSGASSVPTDAFMMIYDDMCEPHDQSVSYPSRNTVVKNSLTAELAIYKEHVELYEQRAKFELTEREQKINKQLRIDISDRNFKEETLKRDLHSIKLQLASTIKHNKSMDNFEGIQKALTKEVKEMKDVFKELEAEVAQHAVVRKHDATELKNLLIANDNLIAKCLSQEVFCVETNSELNAAQFTNMHVANTTAESRCLALKAELANLRETNNQDNQTELINHFSKLEVSHLNLQLKYQDLKDQIGNSPPTPDKDTPDFDSVFVIRKMQAFLQGKDNVIRQLKKELSQLQVTHQDTDSTLRVQTTDSKITKLTDHVTHLQAENDLFRAENDKIKL
nr:hypothetical protein [Tanacetum cinerariifolium]